MTQCMKLNCHYSHHVTRAACLCVAGMCSHVIGLLEQIIIHYVMMKLKSVPEDLSCNSHGINLSPLILRLNLFTGLLLNNGQIMHIGMAWNLVRQHERVHMRMSSLFKPSWWVISNVGLVMTWSEGARSSWSFWNFSFICVQSVHTQD